MVGFTEVGRNYLFTQLDEFLAIVVSESTVKCFEIFLSEAQFLAERIAFGSHWVL